MKRKLYTTTVIIGLALATPALASTQTAEVQKAFENWRTALSSGDPQKIVNLYENDATLLATLAEQPIRTQAERTAYFTTLTKNPNLKATVDDEHVRILDENTAIVNGVYTFSFDKDGSSTEIPARYTFVFEKGDNGWMIVEHHSSQLPDVPG